MRVRWFSLAWLTAVLEEASGKADGAIAGTVIVQTCCAELGMTLGI